MHARRRTQTIFAVLAAIGLLFAAPAPAAGAGAGAATSGLQEKISAHNAAIAALEKEIAAYQTQAEQAGQEAASLRGALAVLDATRKKLSAEIGVIENQIANTNLTISGLTDQIGQKQTVIGQELDALGQTIRRINQEESGSFFEAIMGGETLSSSFDTIAELAQFESAVKDDLSAVRLYKGQLEDSQTAAQAEKKRLLALEDQLSDKKKIAEDNRTATNRLLAATKDKESNYRKLIQQKLALKAAFEKEILDYESALRIAIDFSKLPPPGSAPLSWPLDSIFITQYFGNTAFARANPQVYNGQGHNGIDLRASIGTPIKAALSGTVAGTGNTDTVCPGASYGKWVLITHPDGLSTLYAHLSLIKVASGETVSTGDVVGYSGQTGYATGPHLHLTVFATEGVQIMSRKSKVCNGYYTMPIASLNAYLNPLSYLPAVGS